MINGGRGAIDNDKVGKPVKTNAESDSFVARTLWHYFRGIDPADWKDAKGEEVEEEEDEGNKEPKRLEIEHGKSADFQHRNELASDFRGGIAGIEARITLFYPIQSISTIKIIHAEQAAALDMRTLRRPALSMKKYGLWVLATCFLI